MGEVVQVLEEAVVAGRFSLERLIQTLEGRADIYVAEMAAI